MIDTKEKPKRKYWYKFHIEECVLCGSHEETRERQYTPKPENPADRYDFRQYACDHHFM
jgi:hypothetical protein